MNFCTADISSIEEGTTRPRQATEVRASTGRRFFLGVEYLGMPLCTHVVVEFAQECEMTALVNK